MTPAQVHDMILVIVLECISLLTLVAGILCLMIGSRPVRRYATMLLLLSVLTCVGIVYILQP